FHRGDTIAIRRLVTEAWVAHMGMNDLVRDGKPQTWLRPGTTLTTERTIRSVAGNRITVEVPLPDSLDARYLSPSRASVAKIQSPERLSQVGLEDLHIESPPQE